MSNVASKDGTAIAFAQHRTLEGQDHGAPMCQPEALAPVLEEFFAG